MGCDLSKSRPPPAHESVIFSRQTSNFHCIDEEEEFKNKHKASFSRQDSQLSGWSVLETQAESGDEEEVQTKDLGTEPLHQRTPVNDLLDERIRAPSVGKIMNTISFTGKLKATMNLRPFKERIKEKSLESFQEYYSTLGGSSLEILLELIRFNLPPDVELHTPFGKRRMCYADYTASGRPLHFIEQYVVHVVIPCFANTHTETSYSGLQTTHFREGTMERMVLILFNKSYSYSYLSLTFSPSQKPEASLWLL